jgi:diguanylate cyclase (GGDEF)-like protein
MESIIKHLVEITGHRDHDLLNISVTSALRELTGAEQARALAIVAVGKEIFLQPQVIVRAGQTITVDDENLHAENLISGHPVLEQGIAEHKELIEDRSVPGQLTIWLPIWMHDKVNGCLEVSNPETYTDNTIEVLEGVLIVYRNFQNLLDYSERDSLTGLLNRKTFDDNFSKMLRVSQTARIPGAEQITIERRHEELEKLNWLAVLDIDHFKRVNDQFGHLYGDEVLILIANLLKTSFRPNDRLFRFGGEEFVILLKSSTADDARHIFERFRENVAQHHFPQVGQVTVSVGYAHVTRYEPPVAILGRADQALYYAKSHGRNRCCYYEELMQTGDVHAEQSNDTAEFF